MDKDKGLKLNNVDIRPTYIHAELKCSVFGSSTRLFTLIFT
jgi:hypothetical protein